VAVRHLGRGPEGYEKSEVDRVPNVLMEHWRLESNRLVGLIAQVKRYLPQTEEVRMANHQRTRENGNSAETEKNKKYPLASGILNVPHNFGHGSPLPIQEVEVRG
jgi:hypothetical protein